MRAAVTGAVLLGLFVGLACSGVGTDGSDALPDVDGPGDVERGYRPGAPFDRRDWTYVGEGLFLASWEVAYVVAEVAPAHLVILHGSDDPEETWSWFEAYLKAGGPVNPNQSTPFVAPSAELQGLNPGFHIVVAAATTSRTDADALRDWFVDTVDPRLADVDLSGVYVRDASFPLPDDGVAPADFAPADVR